MASFEFLAIILTGLGLTASIIYYSTILRNADKTQQIALETRQAQLFSQYHLEYQNKELQRDVNDITYNWEWKDYDEFREKYGSGSENIAAFSSWMSVMQFYDGVGVLVRRGLLDKSLVADIMSESFVILWDKNKAVIEGARTYYNKPKTLENAEFLYNEIMKIQNKA